jgi:uncharacterized protein (TIGR02594 family)
VDITPHWLAKRYLTVREFPGGEDHPLIQWWLMRAGLGRHQHDETPWCGAFVGGIGWELDLELPALPARARSWLSVGEPVDVEHAVVGFDVFVLKRGDGNQPGPEVLSAPGHVGFYSDHDETRIWLLAGNQGNQVSVAAFDRGRILGGRRLRRRVTS